MAGLRSSFAASGGALDALADSTDTPKNITVILRGRERVAGLRSSFAASGGALDALTDGAAADDNGNGGSSEAAQPRCAPLQQMQLLFGRSWYVPPHKLGVSRQGVGYGLGILFFARMRVTCSGGDSVGARLVRVCRQSVWEGNVRVVRRLARRRPICLPQQQLNLPLLFYLDVMERQALGLYRRQITRDRATNVARAASNVSSALIFGGIFWRMGCSQSAIQDRMGLLQARTLSLYPNAYRTTGLAACTDIPSDTGALEPVLHIRL